MKPKLDIENQAAIFPLWNTLDFFFGYAYLLPYQNLYSDN